MNDDITGIFDNLNPEDFAVKNTAIDSFGRIYCGFDEFVDEMNHIARFAFAAAAGEVDVMIVVAGIDWVRYYQGYPDETLNQMVDRIKAEAPHATMMWMMQRTECGLIKAMPDHMPDINNEDSLAEAAMFGDLTEALFWYARSTEERRTRSGYMEIDDDHLTVMRENSGTSQRLPVLERLLQMG